MVEVIAHLLEFIIVMNRKLYSSIFYLLLPFILLRLIWRGFSAPAYWRRWGERFGLYRGESTEIALWIHAVSVGEFIASVPLIRRLLENSPKGKVLVTTTTPTGSARVKEEFSSGVRHVYLPYDLPGSTRRFLQHFRPSLGVVMETEIWPNLFQRCGRENISLILANVRLSQRSLEGYQRWIPKLAKSTLQNVTWAAVQGEADAKRLIALGAMSDRVTITGNIKFDMTLPDNIEQQGEELRGQLSSSRPIWIAASTREGEEGYVLDAHLRLLEQTPNALLILVPRHPERFSAVAKLISSRGLGSVRRSSGQPCGDEVQVYLGDSMGEMLLLYSAADVAYVGGSLVPTGSHNMLEPAALGKPVLFGPHRFNFAEASQLLLDRGAAQEVTSADQLAGAVIDLLQSSEKRQHMGAQGRRAVEQNRGALDRLMEGINRVAEDSLRK